MIKLKQFEFEKIDETTLVYDIYKGEEWGVCLSVFIRKWRSKDSYEVTVSGRGISEAIPGKCKFSTYVEAETAARLVIEKMLLQHVEME